ncbi:hypothetical protein B0H67DRAFT_676227, partial [Lasiosphaeris hirsuta]
ERKRISQSSFKTSAAVSSGCTPIGHRWTQDSGPRAGSIRDTESDTDEDSPDDPVFGSGDERGVDSDALLDREQDSVADGPLIFVSANENDETISRRSSVGQACQTLLDAAMKRHEAVVRLLLEEGADIESKDS